MILKIDDDDRVFTAWKKPLFYYPLYNMLFPSSYWKTKQKIIDAKQAQASEIFSIE